MMEDHRRDAIYDKGVKSHQMQREKKSGIIREKGKGGERVYKANSAQQMSIYDSYQKMPEHIKKLIDKSWAKDFAEYIFPRINEERFSVLFSETGSRPNTPVNVIVGSLMLKEYFGQSEEELLMSIYCNVLYQYALHLTQMEKPPLSDRSWSRFRARVLEYEETYGRDLMKEEMESLARVIAEHMGLKGEVKRMDSMMVASRCKRMGRLEILYAVNERAVHLLNRLGICEYIPKDCMHYLEKDDRNDVIYRRRGAEAEGQLAKAIKEGLELQKVLEETGLTDKEEYKLLHRAIDDQTETDENGKRVARDKRKISPTSLQNPSDPDATFRRKAGENYTGYVGNIVETVCESGLGVVTTMDFEQNTYSDSQFLKDYLEQRSEDAAPEIMLTDGAYGGQDNVNEAKAKGVDLVTTCLSGQAPDIVMGEFKLSEDGTEVISCPMGHSPEKSTYKERDSMCRAKFPRCCCENCPYRDLCHAKEQKNSFVVYVSSKTIDRALLLKRLSTEECRQLTRLRNGVECRPSLLRRKMDLDRMPVFGYIRSKIFFMLKTGASNLIALFCYQKRARAKSALFA